MPEGGAVGGIAGRSNTNFGQQNRIEGAERNIVKQENKNTTNTTSARNPSTGNKTIEAPPKPAETVSEGPRTGAKNNVQQQAQNLNSANNVADTSPNQRGQNIDKFV